MFTKIMMVVDLVVAFKESFLLTTCDIYIFLSVHVVLPTIKEHFKIINVQILKSADNYKKV